ncbi:SH3 domain-containing protein [Oceanobacillus rekensis]|uniref:SH3 domain-containing protein n=1 Tax=Oceanobacillus rekensis TaxID=937927 RepID=UPI000B43655E|nr:SH3 domain-containing protein [Oceanobacillus rekensis]
MNNKKKGIIFTILLLLTAAFIAFVAIMQQNFMNQDFTANDTSTIDDESTELKINIEGTDDNVAADDEQIEESEEPEITYSNRLVTADLLNVRSGPGPDFEISGIITIDQEVEVEDDGSEWVKITTDDFTGYVNEKYLSEEE